jgi:hypothetical protein
VSPPASPLLSHPLTPSPSLLCGRQADAFGVLPWSGLAVSACVVGGGAEGHVATGTLGPLATVRQRDRDKERWKGIAMCVHMYMYVYMYIYMYVYMRVCMYNMYVCMYTI